MPAESIGEAKTLLRSIDDIVFTKHMMEDSLADRSMVSGDMVMKHLSQPDALTGFEYQPDDYPGEKYAMYFERPDDYTLKVVVSIVGERLNVVTAHVMRRDW